jgi:hypothetical protein
MSIYEEVENEWEDCEDHLLACCDCGLVHNVEFRVHGGKTQWKVERNDPSTGQVRRHMKRRREGVYSEGN